MAKKRKEKYEREVSKHELARWERETRRQRLILGVGFLTIVIVLVLVGVGWYQTQYKSFYHTVIQVNDTKFNMNYYIKTLKLYGARAPEAYSFSLADEVIKSIEQDELIKQGAEKLGIRVDDSAVDKELRSRKPPLGKDYKDLLRAELLRKRLRDEYFGQKVPVSTEQRHLMVMFLESNRPASQIRAQLEGGESFNELASKFSLDAFSKNKGGDLNWRPRGVLTTFLGTGVVEEYAFGAEVGVVSQPVYDKEKTKRFGYWIIKVLARKAEPKEAQVRAMLLGSEEEARNMLAKLASGEDFAALAKEFSQHSESKEKGGDLGWVSSGVLSAVLEKFVFNTEQELSEPIRDDTVVTKGGYWLVKVLEKDENRQIDDENKNWLMSNLFNEWFTSLKNDLQSKVDHSYLTDERKLWALERAKER